MPINRESRQALLALKPEKKRLIFETKGSGVQSLAKAFTRVVQAAGIRDFTWHDLRHTFASKLAMAGVDIYTISQLLGHSSVTMTARYSHLAPSHLSNAVAQLDVGAGVPLTRQEFPAND